MKKLLIAVLSLIAVIITSYSVLLIIRGEELNDYHSDKEQTEVQTTAETSDYLY